MNKSKDCETSETVLLTLEEAEEIQAELNLIKIQGEPKWQKRILQNM